MNHRMQPNYQMNGMTSGQMQQQQHLNAQAHAQQMHMMQQGQMRPVSPPNIPQFGNPSPHMPHNISPNMPHNVSPNMAQGQVHHYGQRPNTAPHQSPPHVPIQGHTGHRSPHSQHHSPPMMTHPSQFPNPFQNSSHSAQPKGPLGIHEQYKQHYINQQQKRKKKSISAPPLPNDNQLLNHFPATHHDASPNAIPELMEHGAHGQHGQHGQYRTSPHHDPRARPYIAHGQPQQIKKARSQTFAHGDAIDHYLPNLDDLMPTRTQSDGAPFDLPSPGNGFIIKNSDPPPGRKTTSRSLPLKPEHFILDDHLWSLPTSAENIARRRPQKTESGSSNPAVPKPDGSSLADGDGLGMLSPGTIEGIITPNQETASAQATPSSALSGGRKEKITQATWDAFGFSKEEVMSPSNEAMTVPKHVPKMKKAKSESFANADPIAPSGPATVSSTKKEGQTLVEGPREREST